MSHGVRAKVASSRQQTQGSERLKTQHARRDRRSKAGSNEEGMPLQYLHGREFFH